MSWSCRLRSCGHHVSHAAELFRRWYVARGREIVGRLIDGWIPRIASPKAIEGLVLFAFNQGEVCTCPSRSLIQESIYDEFMERALPRVRAIKVVVSFKMMFVSAICACRSFAILRIKRPKNIAPITIMGKVPSMTSDSFHVVKVNIKMTLTPVTKVGFL